MMDNKTFTQAIGGGYENYYADILRPDCYFVEGFRQKTSGKI